MLNIEPIKTFLLPHSNARYIQLIVHLQYNKAIRFSHFHSIYPAEQSPGSSPDSQSSGQFSAPSLWQFPWFCHPSMTQGEFP